MYFYKELNADGTIKSLSRYYIRKPNNSNPLRIEITQEEYEALFVEIIAANQPEETDEISAEEALDIILGVST